MKIYFEPQALWIGIFWRRDASQRVRPDDLVVVHKITWHLCLIPMLPIMFTTTHYRDSRYFAELK